jgi:DNA-binding XRE family transcriptional regulator
MNTIQKSRIEIVPPNQRAKAEQIKAYVAESVERRVAELLARQDHTLLSPFFESEEVAIGVRRHQTMADLRKWGVYYETWGCLVCQERGKRPHLGLGMCKRCYHRTIQRLYAIVKKIQRSQARASDIIDRERAAHKAYLAENSTKTPSELRKVGAPKMKPSVLPTILLAEPGARARQLRELAGLSQVELALAAGVCRSTVISFENGKRLPIPNHCAAIRKVLVEALAKAFWPE